MISSLTFVRRIFGLLPLLALITLVTTAHGTTYYFSTAGSDGNNGTDPTLPKRSLNAAAALAQPGNTILLKRGDAWYEPFANPTALDLRNKSGAPDNFIRFDAYGEGPKPVVAAMARLDDAAWSNVPGTTTWSQPVSGYSNAWRLYVDGVSKYKVNTSNASANESNVDQVYEWYIKPVSAQSGVVYVNTGSSSAGPRNVEVHPVSSRLALFMQNTHYVSIRNIDWRGGTQNTIVYAEAPCSNIVFDENVIQRGNGSGLFFSNQNSPTTAYVSNITVTNNLVDKVWSTYENDPNIFLTGDGIALFHAVDTGLIKGNKVKNWGHVGIELTSYRAGFHGVHNIVVEENEVTSGASGYMHALDVNGFENLTTNNVIRRNLFYDYNATSHTQGNHNKYYSNIFVGVTLTTQPRHSQQPWGIDLIPWRYSDGNWMAAHDNYIVNNTFVDVRRYPIIIGDIPESPLVVGNNVIANNIIYRYGLSGSFGLALNVLPSVRGPIPVRNNNFWNFSTTEGVVRYLNAGAPDYTAAQLNEAYPELCSGNTQLDPGFADVTQRDFRLTVNSPEAVRAGGLDISAVMGEGFEDFAGNPWHPSRPSMGAFQYLSDHTPPVTMVSVVPVPNLSGWNHQDVELLFHATDEEGGFGVEDIVVVASGAHSMEPQVFSGDTAIIAISEEGETAVAYYSTDYAGNQEGIKTETVRLDKTGPIIAFAGEGNYTLEQRVMITSSATDALSGVAAPPHSQPLVDMPAYMLEPGPHTISVSVADNAGNVTTEAASYAIIVTYAGLFDITEQFVGGQGAGGIRTALGSKLEAAEAAARDGHEHLKSQLITAYIQQVNAQTGKSITVEHAALLIKFASLLP